MRNYFTSIEKVNEQFIGTVHDSNTNQAVHRTKPYNTHTEAITDVNNFLQTVSVEQVPQQNIVNTATYQVSLENTTTTEFIPPKRCCGR